MVSSTIFYWGSLLTYLSLASVVKFFLGVSWVKFETKWKKSPIVIMILSYILNTAILYFGFQLHIIIVFLLCIFFVGSVFMGTLFTCIGLTGGIASGKSTVSNILAENGFDIIDTDKISKEVSISSFTSAILRITCCIKRERYFSEL